MPRWAFATPETKPVAGNSTLVEFSLAREGDATRVRVVESGFDALELTNAERERHFEQHTEGWKGALDGLAAHAREVPAAT